MEFFFKFQISILNEDILIFGLQVCRVLGLEDEELQFISTDNSLNEQGREAFLRQFGRLGRVVKSQNFEKWLLGDKTDFRGLEASLTPVDKLLLTK